MSETDTNATSVDRLYLGRQPILDVNEVLIGYQLLFRSSADEGATETEPGLATADVVCKAFVDFGLSGALEGHKAFIIADAGFLENAAAEILPAESVVYEVEARVAAAPAVAERCLALAERGFTFCLVNLPDVDSISAPLLKQAMFVKLNVQEPVDAVVQRLLGLPADSRPILIASHVETPADRHRAIQLGFSFFQGYYFARPALVEGRKIDPALQNLIRIQNLLNQDASSAEIEQVFKGEAALSLKLLRLTHSAGIGLRSRVSSVRQAINIVGRQQIQRWVQLLLFSHQHSHAGLTHNPLMQLAALKGNFMERLARRCYPMHPDWADLAFLAGLMSLLPVVLGMPMARILEQIVVVPKLNEALLSQTNEIGQLLALTDCYDNNDRSGTDREIAALGYRISPNILNQCLADAIAWVQSLAVEAI